MEAPYTQAELDRREARYPERKITQTPAGAGLNNRLDK